MQTKFVIKGSVKHIFLDENLAYFVCVKNDVVWNNQTFGVRHISATIKGATLYDTYQETLDTIQENELCSDCGTQEAIFDFI